MNLIQQLAEYQNAPIQSLEAAKRGANPQISPWVAGAILSDRIEKQKRMAMGQGAAQGPMPTVAEQQDQEVAGIMGALDAPRAQPAQQEPVMAASGGLMDAPVKPGMFDFCGGGIIAFDGGGDVEDKREAAIRKRIARNVLPDTSGYEGQGIGEFLSNILGSAAEGLKGSEARTLAAQRAEAMQRENAKREAALGPLMRDYVPRRSEDQQREADAVTRGAAPTPAPAPAPSNLTPAAAPAGAPSAAPRAPAAGGVLSALTSSPEWADLDAARKRVFEQPRMGQTAKELAAEKEAHLAAQGITKKPWDLAAEQTAELRKIMGQETADRAAKREADLGRPTYRRIIENMGAGSFGQAGAAGTRANRKYQDEMDAADERYKELSYNRALKLNEIDAKAQELRYNEATGEVAKAQQNRQEIAKLKRDFEKDQAAIAQGQAGLRERGAAADLTAAVQKYNADLQALTQRSSNTMAEKRLKVDGLKALESNIVSEMAPYAKAAFTPEAKAALARLQGQLAQVRAEIAKESGLGTLGGTSAEMAPPPPDAVRLKK